MGDRCLLGIELQGGGMDVYPIAEGEMVFTHEDRTGYSTLPSGLGNYAVLQHEGNIMSVYGHLQQGSISREKTIHTGTVLGKSGDSGASRGENLYLSLINIEEQEILNPIRHLIPYSPDIKAPVIDSISVKRDNALVPLEAVQTFKPGQAVLCVTAYDTREDIDRVWKLLPYKISVSRNGQEINSYSFESFSEYSGRLVLSPRKLSFTDIFEGDWTFKLGAMDLFVGKNHIQVFVQDFSGHLATRDAIINVE
jgi:hypothetical protein